MPASELRLAINAVPLASGGGLVGLLGYLHAWRESNAPLSVTVFASRPAVIDAIRKTDPDTDVVSFASNQRASKRFLSQQFALGRAMDGISPDVVMNTNALTPRCRAPQVVHHQNLYLFISRPAFRAITRLTISDRIRRKLAREAVHTAEANAFISDYMRDLAQRSCPGSEPRNHVIHNGIARSQIKSRINDYTSEGPIDLLSIQDNVSHHKDNPTLLKSFARVVEARRGVDWRLHVAGSGDWTPIQNLARQLGVADRVTFYGYLDRAHLYALLDRCLCLVFTSLLEGFGNPPIEAMARGCPVVATACTAIPEIIGTAGILVPPSNPQAFANAICSLYDQPDLRNHLSTLGLARVEEFTWERAATSLLEVVASVANR